MPESPEVEVLTRFVRDRSVGRTVQALELEEFRVLKTRSRLVDELAGRVVRGVTRFGKHLAFATDGPVLVASFGRAGWMRELPEHADAAVVPAAGVADAASVAVMPFREGRGFAFTDAGDWLSFGLSIVDDAKDVAGIAKLGPDPLSGAFTRDDLDRVTRGRRKQLKALLQEQEAIAGIGNAYSDEILHVARLSPVVHAASLDDAQRDRLFAAIQEVLSGALAARTGVPIADLKAHKAASMRVHGRTGEACPVCGGTVADIPGSKGAAQYCPRCQGEGQGAGLGQGSGVGQGSGPVVDV